MIMKNETKSKRARPPKDMPLVVNFQCSLSEVPSDPSWQEGCSNSVDSHEDEWEEEEIEPLDACDTTEFVYNIKGEVVDVVKPKTPETEPVVQAPFVMNVACTHYDVVNKVAAKHLGMKLVSRKEDDSGAVRRDGKKQLSREYDITWHDLLVSPEFF